MVDRIFNAIDLSMPERSALNHNTVDGGLLLLTGEAGEMTEVSLSGC